MCGISGIYRFDKKNVEENLIHNQLDIIKHRGPDGSGIWIKNHVGLGHVRLSILELSEYGAQPMTDRDNRFILSYNGETYNYEELKSTLHPLTKYSGRSDTEVILQGLIQKGVFFVKEMEGMFAFACYDLIKDQMILARDPFGIKPLYYHKNKNRIIFSSEIKPLFIDSEIKIKPDEEAIKEHLVLGYALEPKTAFAEVFKLPPGCIMIINKEGIKIEKYWNISELLAKNDNSFKEIFNRSVLKHTMSDVPLGMFLSGGFDSNIILQSLASQNKIEENFRAYNVGMNNSYEDKIGNLISERNIAKLSSKRFNAKLVEVASKNENFISFEDVIKTVEEPVCNPSNILIEYITKIARQNGNKVLLSGHGGDEIFAGYRRHVAARYLKYLKNPLGKIILKTFRPIINENLYFRLNRATDRHNKKPYFDLIALGTDSILKYKCLGDFVTESDLSKIKVKINEITKPFENRSILKQLMILDIQTYLSAQNLINMDKFSMKNSVEVRVPFLYRPLANVGLNKKDRDLIKWNKNKISIRKYAKKNLPNEIQKIKKSGFSPALIDLAKSKEVDKLLFSKKSKERGILNHNNLRKFIYKKSGITENDAMVLLNYAYIEQWYLSFIDNTK